MHARSIRTILLVALTAFAVVAIPSSALAGGVSAVDALAADAATDGSVNSSSPSTTTSANDSPTSSTYGGGDSDVPPPVDCDSPKTDSSSGSGSGDTSTGNKPATDTSTGLTCTTITECATGDLDGKDANGKPCVECSTVDTDGKDASGKPCVPTTTVVTETPCTDTTLVGEAPSTTVCGGGGEAPVELPVTAPEPVEGGGEPLADSPSEAVGGGAPELPFTGLPLWYAIYGGIGLMILGGALWARGRFGGQEG